MPRRRQISADKGLCHDRLASFLDCRAEGCADLRLPLYLGAAAFEERRQFRRNRRWLTIDQWISIMGVCMSLTAPPDAQQTFGAENEGVHRLD